MNYRVLNFVSTTLQKSKFDVSKLCVSKLCADFADALVENMEARFPLTDLLFSFSVLTMRPISDDDIQVSQHITKRVIQCQKRCKLPYESKQSPLEKNVMVK